MTLHLAIAVAVYNRCRVTLTNLRRLQEEIKRVRWLNVHIFVVDDCSPDKTGIIVARELEHVTVIEGTGGLYWNRGMILALDAVKKADRFDAVLLFNDDVAILQSTLSRVIELFRNLNGQGRRAILVGAMRDPVDTSLITYSGLRRTSRLNPMSLMRVKPAREPTECDTGNGNFILVSMEVLRLLVNLDWRFRHAIGDLDFLYRARAAGILVVVPPFVVGECSRHDATHRSIAREGIGSRLRRFFGPKADPVGTAFFLLRHGGLASLALIVADVAQRVIGVVMPSLYQLWKDRSRTRRLGEGASSASGGVSM